MSEPTRRHEVSPPFGEGSAQRPARHLLVQAPVPPIDVDGLGLATIGTVVFALASILLTRYRSRLATTGHEWWLGVAVSGFVLGLIGLLDGGQRRRQRRARLDGSQHS